MPLHRSYNCKIMRTAAVDFSTILSPVWCFSAVLYTGTCNSLLHACQQLDTIFVQWNQWRNYERRSEAIASGRQVAGDSRGRFWSADCLLCTTEFSRISKERKKLKNKQNDRNLVYLYSFRYWFCLD